MQRPEQIDSPFTLVLGGGGARGLAHIGVLKVLEREGYIPSLIVGSSMGSIVGGMYSQLRDSAHVQQLIEELLYSDIFSSLRLDLLPENSNTEKKPPQWHLMDSLRRGWLLSRIAVKHGAIENSVVVDILSRLLKDNDIAEAAIPFAAVAVNLLTGEEVVLRRGSIIRAVAASSPIPGVVAPVDIDGDLLVDGSVLQVVPIQAARMLSNHCLVAVDVSRDIIHDAPPRTGLDVIVRADFIANRKLNLQALREADVVITPNVGHIDWSDFRLIRQLVTAGTDAAERFFSQPLFSLEPVLVGAQ